MAASIKTLGIENQIAVQPAMENNKKKPEDDFSVMSVLNASNISDKVMSISDEYCFTSVLYLIKNKLLTKRNKTNQLTRTSTKCCNMRYNNISVTMLHKKG